jgi:Na+-driven multidrug efflux pump
LTSALISFLRSLVFQIGAVLLLPVVWEIDGVWISVVIADLMAMILSFIFMAVKRKKYHY